MIISKNLRNFLILLNIYLILEGLNYLNHVIQYEKISQIEKHKKNKKDKKKINLHAKIIKEDIVNHFKNVDTNMDIIFGGKTKNLSKNHIHDLLVKIIYAPYHENITKSKEIIEIIDKYEKQSNIILPEIQINQPNQQNQLNQPIQPHQFDQLDQSANLNQYLTNHDSIKAWYKPLPMLFTFEIILLFSDMMMFSKGFSKITHDNGLIIWFKEGTSKKTNAIIFLHAGAGGILVQSDFINKLPNTHTIIIPEIPGIAFGSRVFIPPTIREISNTLVDFVINMRISDLQLISHSFGGNIISCIINNYIEKLEQNDIKIINTTLIEPIIFLPSLFPVYNLLNEEININDVVKIITNDSSKIFSYILIFRDIYAQYYSKCLTMSDVLMGTTEYEKNNCINVVLSENDELYSAAECEHYLKSKKYNCNIIMRKNNCHGDFCFNKETHDIVINLIK